MYFTPSQKKALLFVIVFFVAAIAFRVSQQLRHPHREYDFSAFEKKFYTRLDSIREQARRDSVSAAKTIAQPSGEGVLATQSTSSFQKPVNINTATKDQLITLPRIGPKMAQRIIDYRREHGPFLVKKDITKVKGIGPKTYEHLKRLIRVE